MLHKVKIATAVGALLAGTAVVAAQPTQREAPSGTPGAQSPTQPKAEPKAEPKAAPGGSGATLTTEQRTKIRETGPRASNVNFSISVGTAVPRTVRVIAVPPTLVQWRGYRYFVVGDEMIIVDRNNRIVAVIAL